MKQFENPTAQGDLGIKQVESIPDFCEEIKPINGRYIVAHSETGHHHTVMSDKAFYFKDPKDPMTCYLRVDSPVALEHHRSHDTHESIMLPVGNYLLRRQRQNTPEGWRMIED